MMNKPVQQSKNIKKALGFSAIELVGVLVVFAFIILATNKIMDKVNQTKDFNQLADQSNLYSNLVIKYIQDNYRQFIQTISLGKDIILPVSGISGYMPSMFLAINKRYQVPCVYITSTEKNKLRAYLIFGNSLAQSKSLSQLEIFTIARAIGNHAGALVNNNGSYNFIGGVESGLVIPPATMSNISNICGFTLPFANLLMIDLSKNNMLFTSIKGNIDQQFSSDTPDPSLKESGLQTMTNMQTNIYLDDANQALTQHSYKAIDYGVRNASGERMQIRSKALSGLTSESSILGVSNAGVQAGGISPISSPVNAGDACNVDEIGKIVQEINSVTINSQVQCMYNPTFCAGSGYCYLPLKSTTFTYNFPIPKSNYSCPYGTVVDGNQPADNISTFVSCPVNPDWGSLVQDVHTEATGCYVSVTKMTFCNSFQTVCTYTKGEHLINALLKLKCTNSTTTYTIDNYTQ